MERYYRFELAYNGEPQGMGFLHGLDEVGFSEEQLDELYELFWTLPSPHLASNAPLLFTEEVSFWFTRAGLEYFAGTINTVIACLAEHNWQLLAGMMEGDLAKSVYHDEYQAAFATEYLETDHTKFIAVSKAEDALLLTDPSLNREKAQSPVKGSSAAPSWDSLGIHTAAPYCRKYKEIITQGKTKVTQLKCAEAFSEG